MTDEIAFFKHFVFHRWNPWEWVRRTSSDAKKPIRFRTCKGCDRIKVKTLNGNKFELAPELSDFLADHYAKARANSWIKKNIL